MDEHTGPSPIDIEYDKNSTVLDYWYPLLFSSDLVKDQAYSISLFGEPLVLFRSANGAVQCLQDRCSHRSTPLSIGVVENGSIECRYHGWRFGEEGKCIRVPSYEVDEPIQDFFRVPHYPATEKMEMIWVWPGDPSKVNNYYPGIDDKKDVSHLRATKQFWDTNYSFEIMMENALDPSHLQFVHEGFQGAGIGPRDKNYPDACTASNIEPLPDGTGFRGHIKSDRTVRKTDYYVVFQYPNFSVADIPSKKPGGAEILISSWVVPLTKNTSRLIFILYRNFMKFLPDFVFARSNNTIVYQDRLVLTSQQLRVEQGSSRWNLPVKADNLSITFRKWWDRVCQEQPIWFGHFESTMKKPSITRVQLKDIEDLGRNTIHPCILTSLGPQEAFVPNVQKLLPALYPKQYKKSINNTHLSLLLVAVVAILLGVFQFYL